MFKAVIPSKIFESMAMGLPILIAMPFGEATDIIEEHKTGIKVFPENPVELSKKFLELAEDKDLVKTLSCNSLDAVQNFDRKKMALKMLYYLEELVN